jgi:hypothetical protein
MNELTATYIGETKRFRKYEIDKDQGAVGTLYLPKEDQPLTSITIKLVKED